MSAAARPASEHSEPGEPVREAILAAALERFLRYGYHKTTMAEIAADADMSAANLYRYFANKLDLASACATRAVNERLERLRLVAERPGQAAAEKLTDYALGLVDHTFDLASEESHIAELVEIITRERVDLVTEKMAVHHALIAHVLREGDAAGQLSVADPEATARLVYSAFMLFELPLFIGVLDRAEFERRARGIVALLVQGLGAR